MTPTARLRLIGGASVIAAALVGMAWAADSAPPPAPVPAPAAVPVPQPARPAVSAHVAAKPGQARASQPTKPESGPTWNELTPQQQLALQPLAASWARLGGPHKRKWLAVSANFPNMPPGEQARLHSRMAEWAALSPQQRTQARLNFAETQTLPVDDKRAKWEAYQALSPEEKKKLAAGAAKPVPPTAAAVRPLPQKLATLPRPKRPEASSRTARLAAAPTKIDHNTLLPQPGTLPVQP